VVEPEVIPPPPEPAAEVRDERPAPWEEDGPPDIPPPDMGGSDDLFDAPPPEQPAPDKAAFGKAASYVISFGKFKGKALDDVASTDRGLGYLVWLSKRSDTDAETLAAVRAYLSNPVIADEVAKL
jgi:hypothetical protein